MLGCLFRLLLGAHNEGAVLQVLVGLLFLRIKLPCSVHIVYCVGPGVVLLDYFTMDPWFPLLSWRWFGVGVGTDVEWTLFHSP